MKSRGLEMKAIVVLCGVIIFLIPNLSPAQEFPTKPINILVAFGPAGPFDVSTRILAKKAEEMLKQPFIISNNGGGGGSVAFGIVAKEKPDGYHLVGGASIHLIRMPQLRSLPYKLEDFVPIMQFGAGQTLLAVRADSPWKTMREFLDYAKKNPGKVTYSSPGPGSSHHWAMEFVAKQEGIEWTMIPFPAGVGASTSALLGGNITAVSGSPEIIPHVKAGSIRILAAHGERRMKSLPEVPTFRELGYDYVTESMFMYAAPKGTPLSIVKQLEDAFHKAMDDPLFSKAMDKFEIEIIYRNSEETMKYLEEAYVRTEKMIKDFRIMKETEKK